MKSFLSSLILLVGLTACDNSEPKTFDSSKKEAVVEATSFSGNNLYQLEVDSAIMAKYSSLIRTYELKENLSEQNYIDLGNSYASIYQFNNAIKIYTDGLALYPNSFKLLRFRAHRLLSIRKVDEALADLEKALGFMDETYANEVEYGVDGKMQGTYEHWIYYHLGLGNYLKGNYEKAISAYENCLRTSASGLDKAGSVYWLSTCYFKAQDTEKGEQILADFVFDPDTDLNYSYSLRILLHQGKKKPQDLMDTDKPIEEWTKGEVSLAFDIGNWYIRKGQEAKGLSIHQKLLGSPYWNVWVYVVTEKDLLGS